MSALSRWLLIPPVSARLNERYQGYRRHGASPFSSARLHVDDSGVDSVSA